MSLQSPLFSNVSSPHLINKMAAGEMSASDQQVALLLRTGLKEAIPAKEGIMDKKGGGTSLFGSRGFKPRFVEVKEGKLAFFKADKMGRKVGDKPQKDSEIELKDFTVTFHNQDIELTPKEGRAYTFRVGAGEGDRGVGEWVRAMASNGATYGPEAA